MNSHLRIFTSFLAISVITFLFIRCDNISGDTENQVRQLSVTMTVGEDNAFDLNSTALAAKHDTNEVELTLIKMLIDNLELETVSDDSLDFEINDLVVDLPLDGDTLELSSQEIPAGSYDKLDIEIDSDIVEDSVLNDSTGYHSIVVQGLYNGEEFTFKTSREFEEEFRFNPPIEVTDSTTTLALNLSIDVDRWFYHANPNNPDDKERIEYNIRKSFNAYCRYGDNKYWQRNED